MTLELFDYLHLGFHFEFPNWTSVSVAVEFTNEVCDQT